MQYDVYHQHGHTFLFMKNMWIVDSSVSCHIMDDDTGLFNFMSINKSIQGSSGIMPATKKGHQHLTS